MVLKKVCLPVCTLTILAVMVSARTEGFLSSSNGSSASQAGPSKSAPVDYVKLKDHFSISTVYLITREDACTDAGISPEVAKKAFYINKEYLARRMDMNHNMSKLYNKETDLASQSKLIMDLRALITDEQFERLKQIQYQIGGPKLAFKDPLRTEFKVTTEQVSQFKAGLESIAQYADVQRKKMALDRKELNKALNIKVRELAVKILTGDQLAQWNEFVGRKFIPSEDSE